MRVGGAALHSPGGSQGSQRLEMERCPKSLVLGFSLDNKGLDFVLEVEVGDLGKGS